MVQENIHFWEKVKHANTLKGSHFFGLFIFCHAVCAEAFNPDEDEEDKEPRVS